VKRIGGAALLSVLTACGGVPESTTRTESKPPSREATLLRLRELEDSFYSHWGSLEGTAAFKALGEEHRANLRERVEGGQELALMALRVLKAKGEHYPKELEALLYGAALGREHDFARWGVIGPSGFLPGVYGGELLELGKAAVPVLHRLLSDRRRAWVMGSAANRIQGDRICDYAWVFLATILDLPLAYHPDPARRDVSIRELDLTLNRRR
jgi:hypothetical protein